MNFRKNIITHNFREWLTFSALIFAFVYLTGDSSKNDLRNSESTGPAQIALVSPDNPDTDSKDVSGSHKPVGESSSWVIATDIVSLYGKTDRKSGDEDSKIARQAPVIETGYKRDPKNTLSLVDSDLANQFTLVGEKPSGTG